MNQVEKRLIDEIDALLLKSTGFNERYAKEEHRIDAELYEDLLYFAGRSRFIWETLKKKDFIPFANGFERSHAHSLHKSSFEVFPEDLVAITSRLRVTKKDIEDGLFFSVSELAKAEVFSAFLESGKHFLDEGYKEAAAIVIGGVLEDKLKTICQKKGLAYQTPDGKHLTIEPLNVLIRKAEIYNELVKKQVTAWGDLRNNAAHARYDQFTARQVGDMYEFVLNFCASY